MFRTSVCSNDAVLVQRYNDFLLAVREYHLDLMALFKSAGAAFPPLTVADVACKTDNKPLAAAQADAAKAQIETARSDLRNLSLDYNRMYNRRKFSNNKLVNTEIDVALKAANARLRQEVDVLNLLEQTADAYAAGNCSGAAEMLGEAGAKNADTLNGLSRVEIEIAAAIAKLSGSCHGAAQSTAPMSPGGISRRAGGGGSQTRSSQSYSVLAPKRLTRNPRGTTSLPLTLSTPSTGLLELTVTTGKKLVIDIHATLGGRGGVLVKLPRGVTRGTAQLTVRFWKGTLARAAVTMSFAIRIA